MLEFVVDNLWLAWLTLAVVCLVMEVASGDFYITCFAVGGLAGAVFAGANAPVWLQVSVFAFASVLSIRLLRPFFIMALERKADKRLSGIDALEGRIAEVSLDIEPGGYGRVKIDGDDWKAESACEDIILKGERVKIVGRLSIILKVERL